jgi:hypothetical protein
VTGRGESRGVRHDLPGHRDLERLAERASGEICTRDSAVRVHISETNSENVSPPGEWLPVEEMQ